jgi:transcriptional regulator with XRE-family HTH domain
MEQTQAQRQEVLTTVKIGGTLALARKAKRLSQTELAKRVGLQSSYISQIESNDRIPTLQTLEAICKILQIPSGIVLLKAKVEENVSDTDKGMFDKLIGALNDLYFDKSKVKADFALES